MYFFRVKLFKIPDQPIVQLFHVQRRFKIDVQRHLAGFQKLARFFAEVEHDRPAEAVIHEQRLAKALILFGAVLKKRNADVFQRYALQVLDVRLLDKDGRQRRNRLNDGVAKLFGPGIAVAGCAGFRVGEAAGGKDDFFCLGLAVLQLNSCNAAAVQFNFLDLRLQPQLNAPLFHQP